MAERNIGRPWTEQEDKLLTEAVAKHGEQDNWKVIADCVTGRTNKACRKRWLHSLSPTVKKSVWTPDEDKILLDLYKEHGPKWSLIARSIPGRTDDACSKRYREALDPGLKKEEWTPDEDRQLLDVFSRIGGRWGKIGQEMQRSGLGCRNRYRLLERKKAKAIVHTTLSLVATPQEQSQLLPLDMPASQQSTLSPVPSIAQLSPAYSVSQLSSPQPSPLAPPGDVPLPVFPESQFSESQLTDCVESQSDPDPLDVWSFFPTDTYSLPGSLPTDSYPSFPFDLPSVASFSPSPHHAPFHYTSSSLSTALSAPPLLPMPLPPVSPPQPFMEIPSETEILPQAFASQETTEDTTMLLDELPIVVTTEPMNHEATQIYSDLPTNLSSPTLQSHPNAHVQQSTPISPALQPHNNIHIQQPTSDSPIYPSDIPLQVQVDQHTENFWKSPNPFTNFLTPQIFENSPRSHEISLWGDTNDDLSSASSTPFCLRSSLSPTSSPNVSSPVDLPSGEQSQSTGSLLFSTARETRTNPIPSSRRRLSAKKLMKPSTQTRLSSSLPLTADPSIRPYACGADSCWPAAATTSCACFLTSKELFDHNKSQHPDDYATEKPYRCALQGCGKSWKSINGLQYHLQLSTAHFRTALSSRFCSQTVTEEQTSANPSADAETEEHGREYLCPVPDCFKAYKHSSGLRYHQRHGHPPKIPVQLDEVPPALARELPTKTRRMRRKLPAEE